MKTYLLKGPREALSQYSNGDGTLLLNSKKNRGVLLSKSKPSQELIYAMLPKASFDSCTSWIHQSELDDLHAEFLMLVEKGNINDAPARRLRVRWAQLQRKREEYEKLLEKVLVDQAATSRKIVLAQGKAAIEIGGETFDPGCSNETVYFTRRRGGARKARKRK